MGSSTQMDFGGLDMVVKGVRTGATTPGQAGTASLSANGVNVKQSVADVTLAPPTIAQLNAAFGTPATLGRGFIATIDDADADAANLLVWTSDASWYFLPGTKVVA